ncbi:MAG: hypothetical protein ACHQYQ_09285 [Bacteriovoracales bacterium]|jgi:surface polysaccharide O-acyltransferase-like enzyme
MDEEDKKELIIGYIFIFIFAVLITGGIVTKRVFHHPEFMMLWHLPAAVFLVMGGRLLTKANRRRYYQEKL